MNEYELPVQDTSTRFEPLSKSGLADAAVIQNAGWFITLRWVVISVFIAFGFVGLIFESNLGEIGIDIPYSRLWILAAVLLAANVPLYLMARRFGESSTHNAVFQNVWMQITLDLLVITALVQVIGTTETFAPFTYLFHIVLACIFFPPKKSLLVTGIAALLYLAVVTLETTAVLPSRSILSASPQSIGAAPFVRFVLALFGVTIWLIVWYISSTLSKTVRRRDQQLSVVNEQLKKTDEEKNRQMLITTHDLKAPFAGIESNIQVLKYQHWEEIPESVQVIIDRIDNRAHMLRDRINAILILGNLKSIPTSDILIERFNLMDFVNSVVEPLKEKAEDRHVTLHIEIPPLSIRGDREQLAILFSNLVSNAIVYSHEHGSVYLAADSSAQGTTVSIRDEGIGIREDALPEIFDEYFRTKEATKFNKQSTGLGLAIVKVIAQKLDLRVAVHSELGTGTTFLITIPRYGEKDTGGRNG